MTLSAETNITDPIIATYVQDPYIMSAWRFAWDVDKANANVRKHGVSFGEARSVFDDEYGLLIDDRDHSSTMDERFVLMGLSDLLRILVVVHAYREGSAVIRIISARKATATERAWYARGGRHET